MTVIRPNSIAGITSIAALGDNISFYSSDGVSISQFNVNINATSGVSTVANLRATGIVTATTLSVGGVNVSSLGVGIATASGIVGTGVTLIDLRGTGISTVVVSSGIGTINVNAPRAFSAINFILS